jgi:hypothetical protein
MMRLITYFFNALFITMLFISVSCDTASNANIPDDKYFVKYYGEDGDQEAVDMVVNDDGTFMLLANSTAGTQAIFVVKADAEGQIIWQKKFGVSTDVAKDIEPTPDGNFVILSDFQQSPSNNDIKLIRITPDGIKIDSVTYGTNDGGLYNDHSSSVTPLTDGGFIVTGYADYDHDASDLVNRNTSIFHFRFANNLVPLGEDKWKNYFGSGVTNKGTKVLQAGDTTFYFFGYTDESNQSNGNSSNKLLLFYYGLNNHGGNTNPVYLGDTNDDTKADFVLKSPPSTISGYLMISTSAQGGGSTKLRVSKLRDPLKFQIGQDKQFDWNIYGDKRLDGVYASPSVDNTEGYLIVANETRDNGETDVLLSKIDIGGGEIWSVNFGSEKNDRAAAVAELPDGRIVIFCTIETIVQTKIALMKLNSRGKLLN